MAIADRFDFSTFSSEGPGYSDFGHSRATAPDLRPILPDTTRDILGVDLTHRIDTSDIHLGGAIKGGGGGTTAAQPSTGTPVIYTTAIAGSAFNISIEFKGTWTTEAYNAFTSSADRLAGLITGDVPDVSIRTKGVTSYIDDIRITAELKAIDGVGGILGQAGPTSLRTGSYLPATASMQFDSADTANYVAQGLFDEIVTHEMLHSLGFGSIWSYKSLVTNALFTGQNALAEYRLLSGNASAAGVPVETDGGAGTAGSHWSEAVFHNELMTGYIDQTDPLSRMTVASLKDLGYVVNLSSGNIDGYALTV